MQSPLIDIKKECTEHAINIVSSEKEKQQYFELLWEMLIGEVMILLQSQRKVK